MKRGILLHILAFIALISANAQNTASLVGRPYNAFDVTAFCSYDSFHPNDYLTDNNWDILCAFVEPGDKARLDTLGITATRSQLRLLEVGGLLKSENGIYSTIMPIFGREETHTIRNESKAFADSIFVAIRPKLQKLVKEFDRKGYASQSYSLLFSYLLDGYIWDEKRIIPPTEMTKHGTWSGAYWAMYEHRQQVKTGTNGFGPVFVNWTDSLRCTPGTTALVSFAKDVINNNGEKVTDTTVIEKMAPWGLVDVNGKILVPVIHRNNGDSLDVLCAEISTAISDSVKQYCIRWAQSHNITDKDLADVIFYHEMMWDLLNLCETEGIIKKPAILNGEEAGKQHFSDITFIVIYE